MPRTTLFSKIKDSIWPAGKASIGKPVYLEESGEQIGVVAEVVTTAHGKPVEYEVDCDGIITRFPAENMLETDRGLIFQPAWFKEAEKFVQQLEFQEKLSPEIGLLLLDKDISREKITAALTKVDARTRTLVNDGISLLKTLKERLKSLENERSSIRREINNLTEHRILGETDRRTFAKAIIDLKRKAQILDINIKRCSELAARLENSPFITMSMMIGAPELESPKKSVLMPAERVAIQAPKVTEVRSPTAQVYFDNFPEKIEKDFVMPTPKYPIEARKPMPRKLRVLKIEKEMKLESEKLKKLEEDARRELTLQFSQERIQEIDRDLRRITELIAEAKGDKRFTDYLTKKRAELQLQRSRILARIKEIRAGGAAAEEKPKPSEVDLGITTLPKTAAEKKKSLFARKGGFVKLGTLITIAGVVILIVLLVMVLKL